jgi:hypothetical protein
MSEDLDTDLRADERFERAVFWRELLVVAVVAAVIVLRSVYG